MKTTLKRRELIKRIERDMGIESNNNLIIGITFGIVIMFCAVVYIVVSFIEAVS